MSSSRKSLLSLDVWAVILVPRSRTPGPDRPHQDRLLVNPAPIPDKKDIMHTQTEKLATEAAAPARYLRRSTQREPARPHPWNPAPRRRRLRRQVRRALPQHLRHWKAHPRHLSPTSSTSSGPSSSARSSPATPSVSTRISFSPGVAIPTSSGSRLALSCLARVSSSATSSNSAASPSSLSSHCYYPLHRLHDMASDASSRSALRSPPFSPSAPLSAEFPPSSPPRAPSTPTRKILPPPSPPSSPSAPISLFCLSR